MNVNGKKRKLKTESWGISIVKEKVWVIKKKKKKVNVEDWEERTRNLVGGNPKECGAQTSKKVYHGLYSVEPVYHGLHSVKFWRHDKFSNNGKVTTDGVVGMKENLEYVGVWTYGLKWSKRR